MVAAGLAFGWLPRHRIQSLLDGGNLLPLPLAQGLVRHSGLYLVYADPAAIGPAARLLGECLQQSLLA